MAPPREFFVKPDDPDLIRELRRELIAHELWSWMNAQGQVIGRDHPHVMEEAARIERQHFMVRAERIWFEQCNISAYQIYKRLLELRAIDANFSPRRKS